MAAHPTSGVAAQHSAAGRFSPSDILGGLTAMLVALPSAIAFGLVVYGPLGSRAAAQGALAGILGSVVIGLIAPVFGGAPRLISAPCAPAAAVLGSLVALLINSPSQIPVEAIPAVVTLVVFGAGLAQIGFGLLGGGRIIKYIPYPVVAGYLSGVGALIILGQIPKLVGSAGVMSPASWSGPSVIVGLVSILAMVVAPLLTRRVPGPIVALAAGVAAYFTLGLRDPALLVLNGNPLLVGPVLTGGGESLRAGLAGFGELARIPLAELRLLAMPVLTLAVLLSIDTLKTCVVLDALTRSRHASNRELIAQGLGNVFSGLAGGMAGAGTMGPTLVNLTSGGRTRASGIFEGVFALLAFLALGSLVAWVPVPALAGILMVVGFRMIDRSSIRLLSRRSTVFDFAVIAAVVATAVAVNLIAAAGVGVGLAILLFLREEIRGSVVRRRALGNELFSKKRRLPGDMGVLASHGASTAIFELQGSLFFGTADQLFTELEPRLASSKRVILDLRGVRSADFTAAHVLEQIEAQLADRGGWLLFSSLEGKLPTGQTLAEYFAQIGVVRPKRNVRVFRELDDALEWAEERVLEEHFGPRPTAEAEIPLPLSGIDILRGVPPDELAALERCCRELALEKGQKLFLAGEEGDEVFLVRSGQIRVELPLSNGKRHHLATFSRGDFLGDLAFLDREVRSADGIASAPTRLYALSRSRFDEAAAKFPTLSGMLFVRMATILALRLRLADGELRALQDG